MTVIVSVTSTHNRLHLLYYMICSMRIQTFKNFKLIVNLSKEPYLLDQGVKEVPSWLQDGNINVRFVENTGSYRKLFPVIQESKADDLIITADDDILFGENWLKKLVDIAKKQSDAIVCARARKIKFKGNRYLGYYNWKLENNRKCSTELLPTNGAGTVFRKKFFCNDDLNNLSYLEHAPTNDDLWFRALTLKARIPVYVDPFIDNDSIYLQAKSSLRDINTFRPEAYIQKLIKNKIGSKIGLYMTPNDKAWAAICDEFKSLKRPTELFTL